jgi:hypothetical protein
MDADDLRAFDEDSAEVGEALWPGEIKLQGALYAVSAVSPRVEQIVEGKGGGLCAGELVIRLRKAIHPERPKMNEFLEWTAADGVKSEWQIRTVQGESPGSAFWMMRCEPKN